MKTKPQSSWYLLVEAYLFTAKLLSDEINKSAVGFLVNNSFYNSVHLVPLVFSAVFNARHGIELFLKSLILIQQNNDGLPKKYHEHDLEKLLKYLEKGENELLPIHSINTVLVNVNYKDDLAILVKIVNKYQKYDFDDLPFFLNREVIDNINDKKNMSFRFPDNDALNEAIRFLFEEHNNWGIDIDEYKKRMFPYLHSIIGLTKEINHDMDEMFRINSTVGNTVAAHIHNIRKIRDSQI
jgi:hypothetical protein